MPKVIDHDQRREHIIDVTWDLIVEGGIEAATMREIAARAGFANGALKHYFPNKATIAQSTFERATATMASHITGGRGIAALSSLAAAILPLDESRTTAGRVLLAYSELAASDPGMKQQYAMLIERWRDRILLHLAEGRADGDIVTTTPDDLLADELILLTTGANVMSLLGQTTAELAQRHLDGFLADLAR